MDNREHHSGLFWMVKWVVIVMVATLIVDCFYVMWPYPNGGAGLDTFRLSVHEEWALLVKLSDGRFPPVAYAIYEGLHTVLFKWPGLDYLIVRAHDPTPMQGGGEMARRGVLAMETFWGTAATGLQLFSARVAVLALSLPLMMLAAIGGISDGLVAWYRRRTGGGRESGFIYHRTKRHASHALLIMCFVYLVPPVTVDPRIVVSAFTLVYAVALRVAASRFKKYI